MFKPINVSDEVVFFEKLLIGLDDTWSEGIWSYHIHTHQMNRMDQGQHVLFQELYDFDTPQISWNNGEVFDSDTMYFATITELDEESYIEFYELDIHSWLQKNLMGFRFNSSDYVYKGMELLSPGYIMFRLSYNMEYVDVDFFDNIYLLDAHEKKYYPVYDELFKINAGSIFVSGKGDAARVFFEEQYLQEDEQYELITSKELELAFDLHESIEPDDLLKNSIKTMLLTDFVAQIKSGATHIEWEVLDEIRFNGSIRLIGETQENIYYKKKHYEFALREIGDFISLRKIGSYEVYRINKETLEREFIRDVHSNEEIRTNLRRAYYAKDSKMHTKLYDFETEKPVRTYKKRFVGRVREELVDFVGDEYFLIELHSDDSRVAKFMIVDAERDEMLIAGRDVITSGNYIFVI